MPTTFGLSFAAVDILSEGLRLNCRVYPFSIPSFGEFADDRVRIAGAIKEDLINRGLADHRGVGPEVVDALRMFTQYHVAVAVMGDADGKKIYARGAVDGNKGMVVRQEDQLLKFEMVRPEGFARAVAGLLPPLKPGPGQSVTITRPLAHPVTADDDENLAFRQPIARSSTPNPAQLRGAEEMLRRKRLGSGHFAVTGRDRNGNVKQAAPLGWIDTDAGRYLVQNLVRDDVEGGTFFPADSARMINQLNELLHSVS